MRTYRYTAPGGPLIRAYGVKQLAKDIGVTTHACWKWASYGVPAERVHETARVLGCRAHDLRPDLFGPNDTGPVQNTGGLMRDTSDVRVIPAAGAI